VSHPYPPAVAPITDGSHLLGSAPRKTPSANSIRHANCSPFRRKVTRMRGGADSPSFILELTFPPPLDNGRAVRQFDKAWQAHEPGPQAVIDRAESVYIARLRALATAGSGGPAADEVSVTLARRCRADRGDGAGGCAAWRPGHRPCLRCGRRGAGPAVFGMRCSNRTQRPCRPGFQQGRHRRLRGLLIPVSG
jgi:hypothetical protein